MTVSEGEKGERRLLTRLTEADGTDEQEKVDDWDVDATLGRVVGVDDADRRHDV